MNGQGYVSRIADEELAERLQRMGAVLVEGAKYCGKTEMARQHAQSDTLLDMDDVALETARIAPANVLEGSTPRLIDEWQLAPGVWNAVRRAVDARRLPGQFILTGSSTPADDETRHSGAGRFSRLRLRTLTLSESGMSSGQVSLAGLLNGLSIVAGQSPLSLGDIIEETCHGGWPADRRVPLPEARRNVSDYVEEITRSDTRAVNGVRRDPQRMKALMRALARNTATAATVKTLAEDSRHLGAPMHVETVSGYLRTLEDLMVMEPVLAWMPELRSKARIRSSPKRYFVDPAISASLFLAGPDELSRDLKTFGFLFESLVLRDLRVYAGPSFAQVYYYRDNTGLEVDAIVDGGFNNWGAFEVKLGGSREVIDKAASSLLRFADRVDPQTTGKPRCLAVIIASGYAYTRADGVHVIPLATLTS